MLKLPTLILFIYSITMPALGQLTDEDTAKCEKHPRYCVKDADSVKIALYYDVDPKLVDFAFVKNMCLIRKKFTHATVAFYPGVSTKVKDKKVMCYHDEEGKNTDCTDSFAAACASKILKHFPGYICCRADGGNAVDCVKAEDPTKVEEFNQCTQLKDPKINPVNVLLENQKKYKEIYPDFNYFPIMTVNEIIDGCARLHFLNEPVKVICAMLAKNTDKACT